MFDVIAGEDRVCFGRNCNRKATYANQFYERALCEQCMEDAIIETSLVKLVPLSELKANMEFLTAAIRRTRQYFIDYMSTVEYPSFKAELEDHIKVLYELQDECSLVLDQKLIFKAGALDEKIKAQTSMLQHSKVYTDYLLAQEAEKIISDRDGLTSCQHCSRKLLDLYSQAGKELEQTLEAEAAERVVREIRRLKDEVKIERDKHVSRLEEMEARYTEKNYLLKEDKRKLEAQVAELNDLLKKYSEMMRENDSFKSYHKLDPNFNDSTLFINLNSFIIRENLAEIEYLPNYPCKRVTIIGSDTKDNSLAKILDLLPGGMGEIQIFNLDISRELASISHNYEVICQNMHKAEIITMCTCMIYSESLSHLLSAAGQVKSIQFKGCRFIIDQDLYIYAGQDSRLEKINMIGCKLVIEKKEQNDGGAVFSIIKSVNSSSLADNLKHIKLSHKLCDQTELENRLNSEGIQTKVVFD